MSIRLQRLTKLIIFCVLILFGSCIPITDPDTVYDFTKIRGETDISVVEKVIGQPFYVETSGEKYDRIWRHYKKGIVRMFIIVTNSGKVVTYIINAEEHRHYTTKGALKLIKLHKDMSGFEFDHEDEIPSLTDGIVMGIVLKPISN